MNHSFFEINLMGIILLALLFFHNKKTYHRSILISLMDRIIIFTGASTLSDTIYYLLEGRLFPGAVCVSYLCMFVYFISGVLSAYFWLKYVLSYLYEGRRWSKTHELLFMLPMLIVSVMALSSPFTHWIFYITPANFYTRGSLYIIQPFLMYAYLVFASIVAFLHRKKEILRDRKNTCLFLGGYTLFPLLGGATQVMSFGLNTAAPSAVISIVILYLDNVRQQVSLDCLTKLNNRGQFDNYLDTKMDLAQTNELCLVFMDIDGFKDINDHYGHLEGDKTLSLFADVLKTVFSSSMAFLCRYGGDEFAIVIDGSEDTTLAYLDELNSALAVLSTGSPYPITVSVGYAVYDPETIHSADQLIRLADAEMYANKNVKKTAKR